jgi:hypothetical protein
VMTEEESITETSVNFCQLTKSKNSEDGHLYTRRRENLNSHLGISEFALPFASNFM